MEATILVAVLSLCGTLIGSIAGILTANKLTNYRIGELEKKVERHNEVVERVALLQKDNDTQWKRIDDLRADLEQIKKMVYRGE